MITLRTIGKTAVPDREISPEDALILLMWLTNRRAKIERITAKEIQIEIIGFVTYQGRALIFSGEGEEFEKLIWMARDADTFELPRARNDPFNHFMTPLPANEVFNLMGRPPLSIAWEKPFYQSHCPGTLALAVQMGISEYNSLYKINSFSLEDQEALLEMLVRSPDPLADARMMGVPV